MELLANDLFNDDQVETFEVIEGGMAVATYKPAVVNGEPALIYTGQDNIQLV